jgi:hypothetical protein
MQYLGGLSGSGVLKRNGKDVARALYDFDGYFSKHGGITCSGEIQVEPDALTGIFGLNGLQLLTDDGRLLELRCSGKKIGPSGDVAHVDVSGQLPATEQEWRH